jgi:acetyl esterase/lipase
MNLSHLGLLVLVLALALSRSTSQQVVRLWPQFEGKAEKDNPSLTLYAPDSGKASGAAIVICPGGAYRGLAAHEGEDYARFLAGQGITGIVLKYRHGGAGYKYPDITADAARAIRMVRSNAHAMKLNPKKIGIMGSSAGGHLAATMVTHFDEGDKTSADPIERVSSRPDFGILCYPVISMGPISHAISREQFLGLNPSKELVKLYSNELQVTEATPPCFLWHTYEDSVVSVKNSLEFARALEEHHVPFDIHVYEHGRHGLGLGDKAPFAHALPWTKDLVFWLKGRGII